MARPPLSFRLTGGGGAGAGADFCWGHNNCPDCFRRGFHVRRHPDHRWKARTKPDGPLVPLETLPPEWWAPYFAAGTAQSLLRGNENSNSFRSIGAQRAAVLAVNERIARGDHVGREEVLGVLKELFGLLERGAERPRDVLLALTARGLPPDEASALVAHALMVRARREPQAVRVLLINDWGLEPDEAEAFIKGSKGVALATGEGRRDHGKPVESWGDFARSKSESMQKGAGFLQYVSSGHPWSLVRAAFGGTAPAAPEQRLRELLRDGQWRAKSDPLGDVMGQRKYTS
eukprot:tig00021257_g19743.t1